MRVVGAVPVNLLRLAPVGPVRGAPQQVAVLVARLDVRGERRRVEDLERKHVPVGIDAVERARGARGAEVLAIALFQHLHRLAHVDSGARRGAAVQVDEERHREVTELKVVVDGFLGMHRPAGMGREEVGDRRLFHDRLVAYCRLVLVCQSVHTGARRRKNTLYDAGFYKALKASCEVVA